MSTVPTIKSHFASSSKATPCFSVHASGGATPTQQSNSLSGTPTSNLFANASSSYQSHFGDFSSGGVKMGMTSGRAPSNASGVSSNVGVVGGGVPSTASSTSAMKSSNALPIGGASSALTGGTTTDSAPTPLSSTPPSSTTTAGGAATLTGGGRRRSSPSSHGNSPHIVSMTPTVKFAAAIAASTSPKKTPTLGAVSAANSLNDFNEGIVATSDARKASVTSGTSLDAPLLSVCPPLPSSSSHDTNTNSNNTSKNSSCSCNATSKALDAVEQAEVDEKALSDAQKYAVFALSTTSGVGGGVGGVSLSPTSPATPHSGTPSPTNTAPQMDLVTPSTSSVQLSAQHLKLLQQQQHGGPNFLPTAPLTPLSAQSSSSRHSNGGSRDPVVNVYDSDFKTLLSIPASQVVHRPHPSLGVSRLVLCRNYSPENPAACSKGEMCKFVHADVSSASCCSIHVNYAWRCLELCTYPRLPAGDELTVLAPNERQPSEVIPSERILVTRGSTNWREHTALLSHCAHYYFNRMCNRGERCNFIHAVHVDPNVQGDFKRAPAPTAVPPIVSKTPTSPALRGANDGGNSARSPVSNALPPPPPPPLSHQQPQPPQPPQQPCGAFGFAPNVYTSQPPPPPPPGTMAYSLSKSPTAGSGPYMMFSGGCGATGFVPATLVPPPSTHLSNSNGVYLLVPACTGMSPNGSATPNSPVSPLGQSLGSMSNGPIDWSFYGDLETAAWMPPPSPSSRI